MPHLDEREVWHLPCSGVAFVLLSCGVLRSLYFSFVTVLFNDGVVVSILLLSTLLFSYAREGRFSVLIADTPIVTIVLLFFVFAESFQVVW